MEKRPVSLQADWVDSDAEESLGTQITKRGRHHLQEYVARKKGENAERRERYLRDFGGRESDARRVPKPEHVDSGRTWKSSSKVRFPSRAFRRNWDLIDWRD